MFNLIPSTLAAGPIDTAPRLVTVLTNILSFLLSIVGVIAILASVVAGMLYFFAGGDLRRIDLAKRVLYGSIVGIAIALGGLVIVRTLSGFV